MATADLKVNVEFALPEWMQREIDSYKDPSPLERVAETNRYYDALYELHDLKPSSVMSLRFIADMDAVGRVELVTSDPWFSANHGKEFVVHVKGLGDVRGRTRMVKTTIEPRMPIDVTTFNDDFSKFIIPRHDVRYAVEADAVVIEPRRGGYVQVKRPARYLADALSAQAKAMARRIDEHVYRTFLEKYVTVDALFNRPPLKFHKDAFAMSMAPLSAIIAEGNRNYEALYGPLATTTTKEKKPMKVKNKFYVAAPGVTADAEQAQANVDGAVRLSVDPNDRSGRWTRNSLKDALRHAEQVLEADPKKDHVAVVQIVRVVRRKKAPVVVEVVK